jgi:hypothetical protein
VIQTHRPVTAAHWAPVPGSYLTESVWVMSSPSLAGSPPGVRRGFAIHGAHCSVPDCATASAHHKPEPLKRKMEPRPRSKLQVPRSGIVGRPSHGDDSRSTTCGVVCTAQHSAGSGTAQACTPRQHPPAGIRCLAMPKGQAPEPGRHDPAPAAYYAAHIKPLAKWAQVASGAVSQRATSAATGYARQVAAFEQV